VKRPSQLVPGSVVGTPPRRVPLCFAVVLLISIALQGIAHPQSSADEYRVKAAYLFHFAQLVDWPPSAFGQDDKSVFFCTYGDDPFHGELEKMEGKQIQARSVRVRHLKETEDARNCQILFVDKSQRKHFAILLAQLGGAPVVTVGESDNFVQEGGVIRFCLEDNKVRFEINLEAAERARLKISSRLLLLAKTVVGKIG
jgi:hypothetical protein